MTDGRFSGKTAFITGASSGIGAAVAEELAREGAKVVLAARRSERLSAVADRIAEQGGQALALGCDVRDRAQLDAAAASAIKEFGALDVVLANAGFAVRGHSAALVTEDYRRQFETNVFGLLDTIHATLPHLEASQGRLGLVCSVSGRMGSPESAPYAASKFAVAGIAECLYYDLADSGISVTCVVPGFVESEIRRVNNYSELTEKPDPVPKRFVIPAAKAARRIVDALYRRKPEVLITRHAKFKVFMTRHFPRTTRQTVGAVGRMRARRSKRRPWDEAEAG